LISPIVLGPKDEVFKLDIVDAPTTHTAIIPISPTIPATAIAIIGIPSSWLFLIGADGLIGDVADSFLNGSLPIVLFNKNEKYLPNYMHPMLNINIGEYIPSPILLAIISF